MEHLVKRDSSYLLNPGSMRMVEIGDEGYFTQSKRGSPFFALNDKRIPRKVRKNDILWIMESGYGVYAKGEILEDPTTEEIKNEKDLEQVRLAFRIHFSIQDNFWEGEREKLREAIEKNQSLYFTIIKYKVINIDFEHFPVKYIRGQQSSWMYLYEERINELFLRNISIEKNAIENANPKCYFNIPNKVKYYVSKIWKNQRIDGKPMYMGDFEYDHFIPKSFGGPGIFPENVVPISTEDNRYKSNRIPKELVLAAEKHKIIRESEKQIIEDWNSSLKNNSSQFEQQKNIALRITEEVKKWDVKRQREFYFDILEKRFPFIKQNYKDAGIELQ